MIESCKKCGMLFLRLDMREDYNNLGKNDGMTVGLRMNSLQNRLNPNCSHAIQSTEGEKQN